MDFHAHERIGRLDELSRLFAAVPDRSLARDALARLYGEIAQPNSMIQRRITIESRG